MAEATPKNQGKQKLLVMAVVLAAAIGAVYSALSWQTAPTPPAAQTTASSAPAGSGLTKALATRQMKNFVFNSKLPAMPELTFKNAKNEALSLENWKGRVVLLNLWATWCAPCRHEMPSLNRLQEALGGDAFEVLALSVDRKGLKASAKFLEEVKASALGLYNDKSSEALQQLKVIGLPATLLIDRQGREIGRLVGPAEWDAPEAQELIKAALAAE